MSSLPPIQLVRRRKILDVRDAHSTVQRYMPYVPESQRKRVVNAFFTRGGKSKASDPELYSENPLPPLSILLQRRSLPYTFSSEQHVDGYYMQAWNASDFPTFLARLQFNVNNNTTEGEQDNNEVWFVRLRRDHREMEGGEGDKQPRPSIARFMDVGCTYSYINEQSRKEERVRVLASSAHMEEGKANARATSYVVVQRIGHN